MSKFVNIVVGGAMIAAGIALDVFTAGTLGNFLITAGAGILLSGLGSLLSGGAQTGLATATRNPIAPWNVVYGRARVGGTIVYIEETGDNNKYLHMVFVLACHACQSVDALLFNNQRVPMSTGGTLVREVGIQMIQRTGDTVLVALDSALTMQTGDRVSISGVTGDSSLNGTYPVTVLNSATFQYQCSGSNGQYINQGSAFNSSATREGAITYGDSYSKDQQTASIATITRANGVVSVEISSSIEIQTGDTVQVKDVSDATFNGQYEITLTGTQSFTYICGGADTSLSGTGSVETMFPDYGSNVHMEVLLGDHSSTFSGLLSESASRWTADHKLLGKTAVYLRLQYDDKVFANGIPAVAFLLHGKCDILDPRTSPASRGYTENSALIIADYLSDTSWGFRAEYGTEIPYSGLIAAANICDESVPLAAGGHEPRYTCNGTFPLSVRRGEVLQNLLTSCGGRLTYAGGEFIIHPAAWSGLTVEVDSSTAPFAGPFQWKAALSSRELYNGVKGVYVSPSNNWQAGDFPAYCQDSRHGYDQDVYLIEDGERRWLDIQLPFTISSATAQRLAKIELMRRRRQGAGTFAFSLAMYDRSALDLLEFTFPYLGWAGKLLEVTAARLTLTEQKEGEGNGVLLGTELDVQETDPSVYEWTSDEELTPQGYQQAALPGGRPEPPQNVQVLSDETTATLGGDGINRSRILVTWDAITDAYVLSGGQIEARYQEAYSPVRLEWVGLQSMVPQVTSFYIDGVEDGTAYYVEVRCINAGGYPSEWVKVGPVVAAGLASTIGAPPASATIPAEWDFGSGLESNPQVAGIMTEQGPKLAVRLAVTAPIEGEYGGFRLAWDLGLGWEQIRDVVHEGGADGQTDVAVFHVDRPLTGSFTARLIIAEHIPTYYNDFIERADPKNWLSFQVTAPGTPSSTGVTGADVIIDPRGLFKYQDADAWANDVTWTSPSNDPNTWRTGITLQTVNASTGLPCDPFPTELLNHREGGPGITWTAKNEVLAATDPSIAWRFRARSWGFDPAQQDVEDGVLQAIAWDGEDHLDVIAPQRDGITISKAFGQWVASGSGRRLQIVIEWSGDAESVHTYLEPVTAGDALVLGDGALGDGELAPTWGPLDTGVFAESPLIIDAPAIPNTYPQDVRAYLVVREPLARVDAAYPSPHVEFTIPSPYQKGAAGKEYANCVESVAIKTGLVGGGPVVMLRVTPTFLRTEIRPATGVQIWAEWDGMERFCAGVVTSSGQSFDMQVPGRPVMAKFWFVSFVDPYSTPANPKDDLVNTIVPGLTPFVLQIIGLTGDGAIDARLILSQTIAAHLGVYSGVFGVLPGAITKELVAARAIDTIHIVDEAVGQNQIAPFAVTAAKIGYAAIGNAHIDRLTSNKLAVVDADIVNLAAAKITAGELASDVIYTGTILANQVLAGTIEAVIKMTSPEIEIDNDTHSIIINGKDLESEYFAFQIINKADGFRIDLGGGFVYTEASYNGHDSYGTFNATGIDIVGSIGGTAYRFTVSGGQLAFTGPGSCNSHTFIASDGKLTSSDGATYNLTVVTGVDFGNQTISTSVVKVRAGIVTN